MTTVTTTAMTLEERVEALERRLEAVANAQTRQHDEIVTRRLCVVDDMQEEQFSVEVSGGACTLHMTAPSRRTGRGRSAKAGVKIAAGLDGGHVAILDNNGDIAGMLDLDGLFGVAAIATHRLLMHDEEANVRLDARHVQRGRVPVERALR
jgi:hypothetical protein